MVSKVRRYALMIFLASFLFRFLFILPFGGYDEIGRDSYHHLNIARSLFEGRGFITDVIWPLFWRAHTFPQPYFFRQPIYPYLLVLSFKLFGESLLAAQAINVIFEAAIASLVFLLAYELVKSFEAALLSSLIYLVTLYPLYLSPQLMTESVFTFFVIAFFYTLLAGHIRYKTIILGIILGLSYLTREQGIVLIFCFFAYVAYSTSSLRSGFNKSVTVLIIAILVCSPWLYRTWSLTGNPIFSFSNYGALIPVDWDSFFLSTAYPSSMSDVIYSRFTWGTLYGILFNLPLLFLNQLIFFFPNPAILLIIYLFRNDVSSHIIDNRYFYLMVGINYALTFFGAATTYGQFRYLYSSIPILSVIGGFSMWRLFHSKWMIGGGIDYLSKAIVVLLLLISSLTSVTDFINNDHFLEDDVMASLSLSDRLAPTDVIMVYVPYSVSYRLRARTVAMPYNVSDLGLILGEYNVTYVIQGSAPKGWYNLTDYPGLERISDYGGSTVYLVHEQARDRPIGALT
jgi:hypothetical protein